MGLILTIRAKYQCCVDDSAFNENEEEFNSTPRNSVMKEPFKLTENIIDKIDSFRTTVDGKTNVIK